MTLPRVLISGVGISLTRVILLITFCFLNLFIHTTLSGQGINQSTFTNIEIGTTIHQFANLPDGAAQATVGTQPTIIDFQHGELIVGAGASASQGFDSSFSWWDLSNPRNPFFVTKRIIQDENKPHVLAFWGTQFMTGQQGNPMYVWDYTTRTEVFSHIADVKPIWWTVQAPYAYRTTNGYINQPNQLEIIDFSDTANIQQLNLVDLNQLVGFYIGATHPLGNLLICSASQAKGVAVLDISDPTNPTLLSSTTTTDDVYTSFVHGTRLYTGERTSGIGVYNFEDPQNIVAEGIIPLIEGGDARYISVKENIGWCAPNTTKLYKFDAITRQVLDVYDLPSPGSDFVFPLGNMVITGGNSTHSYCGLIAVDMLPDTQGPIVESISPSNGATGQHTLTRVGLVMSDQIDVASLNATNFTVRPVGGTALSGIYSTQMGIVNFTPDTPLSANTTYEVVVKLVGIRDSVGNGAREEFYSVFSTGGEIDIDAGLAGHYKLDESVGTIASDASSGNNDGLLTNFGASPWRSGHVGSGALVFDGVDDNVAIANGANYLKDAFNERTVALWFKAENTNSTQVLYEEGGGTSGYVLRLRNGLLEARAKSSNDVFDLSIPFTETETWHHIAAAYEKGGDFMLYLDGVLVDSVAVGDIRVGMHTGNPSLGGTNGADPFNAGGANTFEGTIDDVRIYNRSLNASEIFRLKSMEAGFLGHWRLNDSVEDSSEVAQAGSLQNGASYSIDAAEGSKSVSFDGVNDYIDLGVIDIGNLFTCSAWVKIPSTRSSGLETIFDNSGGGFNKNGFKLFIFGKGQANEGRIQFETGNGNTGNAARSENTAFEFDQWNHLAVTVDRSSGIARIYYNGVDVTVDETIRTDFATDANLQLGQMITNNQQLFGMIDDFRIYNRLFDSNELGVLSIGYPLAHYTFDNTSEDISGLDHTLELRNGAGYTEQAVSGSHALILDGNNDYGITESFDIGNEVTISVWVRIASGSDSLETILANTTSGAGDGFKLFTYGSLHDKAGRIAFEVGDGSTNNPAYSNTGVFYYDQWNHIAVTYDRIAGIARILYNRVDVTQTPDIKTTFNTVGPLHIGQMTNNAFRFGGELDELRIFGSIANDSQLGALGFGSPDTPPIISTANSSSSAQTVGSNVVVSVAASDANVGEELLYRFNFGDGIATTDYSDFNSATHFYSAPGRYIVTATVTDGVETDTYTFTQIVHHPLTTNAPTQSSTIVFDSVRDRVWVVNPDNDSVTRINAVKTSPSYLAKDFERAVGDDPQSVAIWQGGNEAWVACKGSGTIVRFRLSDGTYLGNFLLGRGYQPVGIAFAPDDSYAFVACQGAGIVVKVDPNTRTIVDTTFLDAAPRAVAVSADSSRIFVTRLQSPHNQGEVWELSAADLPNNAPAPFALAFDTSINTSSGGRGVPNYLLNAVITPDGRQLLIPSKKDNVASDGGLLGVGEELTFENTTRSIFSTLDIEGASQGELIGERFDVDDTGLPSAVVFSPYGDVLFATFIMNNKVVAFDAVTKNQIAARDVGFAPDGLCLSDDGETLFVHNFLSRSVTALSVGDLLDGTSGSMTEEAASPILTVLNEELIASVLNGKRIFYNATDDRMSSDDYISCASCHLNGDQDGRVWDFTARGEGLRNTTSLLGRAGVEHGVVHWTGNFDEIQDFELDILNHFGGSGFIDDGQNGNHPWFSDSAKPNAGRNSDLDDLAAYVASLSETPDSPYRDADGTLSVEATAGRTHFATLDCASCHSGSRFTDSGSDVQTPYLQDVGTWLSTSGQRLGTAHTSFDTPTLRGVWATAPYLHDGRYDTIESMFADLLSTGTAHDISALSAAEQSELIAYLYEIDDSEAAPDPVLIQIREDHWTQSSGWKLVTHGGGYDNPIVVVGPVTSNNDAPALVRVRNVEPESFEYTIDEWEYQNDIHADDEIVHFIIMNEGTYTIDGKQVIAGVANNVNNAYSTITFPNAFPSAAVVFGQIVTNNDPKAVSLRIRNINATGFQTIAQEEEGSVDNRVHGNETVHYIAVQAGDYTSLNARAGKSPNAVTHNSYSLNFGSAVGTGAPLVMMEMQTVDGGDPCGLRWTENSLSNTGVNVFVEEEDSDGTGEFAHTTEVVGYFVFGTD